MKKQFIITCFHSPNEVLFLNGAIRSNYLYVFPYVIVWQSIQFVNSMYWSFMGSENNPTVKVNMEYMGTMIRQAREEMGISQEELADRTFRRRLAISEMENGKVAINAWTLLILSDVFKKPLSYFFPPHLIIDIPNNSLNPKEHELIKYFRKLNDEDLEKTTISIVEIISNYNSIDIHSEKFNNAMEQENLQDFLNLVNRKSKKDS